MTGLIIATAVLIPIVLILLIRVKIVIDFHGDDVKLLLKILGIPIKLMPRKEKKKKIRLSDYSYKSIQKQKEKEAKKKLKKASEKQKKKSPIPHEKEKGSFTDKISLITELVKYLLGKFLGHLRIDVTEIKISVGSEDAAKTAIMYGVVSQAAAILIDVLEGITNVKRSKRTEISVVADFTSEKIRSDINIAFSLKVWHAFSIALGVLRRYIVRMINKAK